jgi:predicted enzyme related to lactoylglutathione lyase
MEAEMFLGLRTVIYHVADLERGKEWYTRATGVAPYFDQPFYVGFNIGGYELGLDPDASNIKPGPSGSTAYWGVEDIDIAYSHLLEVGATKGMEIQDVGGDIRVASVFDPFGNVIGIIQNPHFSLQGA